MFTGIVTDVGEVIEVQPRGDSLSRIKIACSYDKETIATGASMACSGICLTVVESGMQAGRTWFAVDAAAETLKLTTAGRWAVGERVNLERALKHGDELGGHIVSGHIDGIAEVIGRQDTTDTALLTLRAPSRLARFIAVKGSVTLDGVSLTVNTVQDDIFSVLVIPHTLRATTLGAARVDGRLNLEVDMMARYAARLAEAR